MAKSIDDILGDAGLERSSAATPQASDFETGVSDSASDAPTQGRVDSTAPSVGAGKLKGRERLVAAATDAFRRAHQSSSHGGRSASAASPFASPIIEEMVDGGSAASTPAEVPTDDRLVRVVPKDRSGPADVAAGEKVVVVSPDRGKIIGRQG